MPRNGTRSSTTPAGERCRQPLPLEGLERGAGGADAWQHEPLRREHLVGRCDEATGESEVLERVQDARRVPRPVVDDVDHE